MSNGGERTAAEAFRCFERWQAEHDPDGEMELLDAVLAYSKWADTNSIARYLDAAQSPAIGKSEA
jgi:hypothetical protein